jgi:hypothetical protein
VAGSAAREISWISAALAGAQFTKVLQTGTNVKFEARADAEIHEMIRLGSQREFRSARSRRDARYVPPRGTTCNRCAADHADSTFFLVWRNYVKSEAPNGAD